MLPASSRVAQLGSVADARQRARPISTRRCCPSPPALPQIARISADDALQLLVRQPAAVVASRLAFGAGEEYGAESLVERRLLRCAAPAVGLGCLSHHL